MIEAFAGVAVGVLTIVVAQLLRGRRWMYSVGLLVLPGLYVMFALEAGEQAIGVKEMLYGIPYWVAGLVFTFVSLRHSAFVVGALWMLHGAYDMTHARLFANPGVPGWYPVWCCAVDVVVGGYLLWLSRRVPEGDLRKS